MDNNTSSGHLNGRSDLLDFASDTGPVTDSGFGVTSKDCSRFFSNLDANERHDSSESIPVM